MSQPSPYVLGITGTIGSGKSFVGRILEELNVPVIDTDKIVHHLLTVDGPTRTAVVQRFGTQIVEPANDGAINRTKLGAVVFGDSEARRELEALVHPGVILECRKRIKDLSEQHGVIAVLVPLLYEAGLAREYDEIWVVYTAMPVLRERLAKRDGLTQDAIEQRLAAQWDQLRKAALADKVIDNSGTLEETRQQVVTLVNKIPMPQR